MKMLRCNICGQIITVENDTGMPISCCGEVMEEIIPNTTDGATEKHVPVCEKKGCELKVCVGETPHPMTSEHYIDWIMIETNKGKTKVCLCANDSPSACFTLREGENVERVYAHCNIHGLWMSKC